MATRRSASRGSVTGAITDLQRRIRLLQTKPAPTRLANQVVARSAIQPRAVATDQIALDAVTNDQIAADAIKREQIDVGAVGTTEIDNLAVTTAKIDDEAVIEEKLGPLSVTNTKLQDAAVQLRNMTPNSVQNSALITDSVNFRTLAVNAVGNENMLDNSVGNAELQNDSVGNGELRNDSVGFSEMQSNSVGNSTLQNGSVTRSKIGSGQVGTAQIENNAITNAKIGPNAVGLGQIVDNAQVGIVNNKVLNGLGLSRNRTVSGVVLGVNFGTASNQAARGNHTHSGQTRSSTNSVTILGQSVSRSSHFHTLTISSKRYKKDITDYAVEDPKKILGLQLKKYKYKNSAKDIHKIHNKEWLHGYIVEEVEDLGLTEVVAYDKEGRPDAIDYAGLSLLMVELLKEHQKEIGILKSEIKNLKDNND